MVEAGSSSSMKNGLIGGAVVVAVGLGLVMMMDDSAPGCKVTASGVAVIANGLAHGRPTTQIVVDATAGLAANQACEALVEKLKSEPAEPVALEVATAEGTGEVTVTGATLAQPPPVRTTCDDWLTLDYQQACVGGAVGPPVIDLNPGQPTCQDWNLYVFVEACQQGRIGPPVQE